MDSKIVDPERVGHTRLYADTWSCPDCGGSGMHLQNPKCAHCGKVEMRIQRMFPVGRGLVIDVRDRPSDVHDAVTQVCELVRAWFGEEYPEMVGEVLQVYLESEAVWVDDGPRFFEDSDDG